MRSTIKKILHEETKNLLKEIKIDKEKLLHDLMVMDFNPNDAEDELNYYLEWFKSLPNELKLYRIVFADDKSKIDTKQPGKHFSIDKENLLAHHDYTYGYGENKYLISVLVNKSLVDPQETISNNILYPNENEITLKNKGKGVKILKITKL